MTLLLLSCCLPLMAWDWWPLPMAQPDTCRDSLFYVGEFSMLTSSGLQSPSLLHNNTNGSIATQPHSGNLSIGIIKPATRPSRWFDYDFGVILTGRVQGEQQFAYNQPRATVTGYFREAYAHVRLYIIDITAGIKPEVYGAQDPVFSSGGFLYSGNTQPIPRITIGIDNYTPIPGLFGYLEFKGGLTHGWFVDYLKPSPDAPEATTGALLHHLNASLRAGGKLPVNISYSFHHAAQWGGVSPIYGAFKEDFKTWLNICKAGAGGSSLNDQLNAEGNHIGFQEWCLWFNYGGWEAHAYWQTIFEDKSAKFIGFGNITDGLWGIHVHQHNWPFINAFTYEYLNTTAQDGPYHDKDGLTYGGNDTYFYNTAYRQGWTHFGRTIGNPLISVDNNRVRNHFVALGGDIYGYKYRIAACFTKNWGTYKAPLYSENKALLIEVRKHFEKAWGLDFGLSLGADFGTQFGTSVGALFTISKRGLLIDYK